MRMTQKGIDVAQNCIRGVTRGIKVKYQLNIVVNLEFRVVRLILKAYNV